MFALRHHSSMKAERDCGSPKDTAILFGFLDESGVRMQGMRGEFTLRLMPLHPNEQHNEAYSYATKGSGANAEFVAAARESEGRSDASAFIA